MTNVGNASMRVSDFTLWANWVEPPTPADPQHTGTALPVDIAPSASSEFSFTVNVPASAAGGTYHIDAELLASNPNATGGWTTAASGAYPGWNRTVLASAPTPVAGIPSYQLIVIALLAASISIRLVFYYRKHRASKGGFAGGQAWPPPQPPGYPPPPGYAPPPNSPPPPGQPPRP